MGLTLVTGRANSGKSGIMYGVVRDASEAGRYPTLLMPTYPDASRALAEIAGSHPLGLRVTSFDKWSSELWCLHGDGRRIVREGQRATLIAEAVRDRPLSALQESSLSRGFVRFLANLAAATATARGAWQSRAPSLVDRELASILSRYQEILEDRRLIEPEAAVATLAADPPPVDGPIVAHRFDDLTAGQEALIGALADQTDIWISLPWEEAFPATEAVAGLVARLAALGTVLHCSDRDRGSPTDLKRLEESLFSATEARGPDGAVEFCTAAGAEGEAALIAERVARMVSEGTPPDRIAVVFRRAERHLAPARLAFRSWDVPAEFDVLVPVLRTPFGTALRSLLEGVAGDSRGLVRFLTGPFSGADPAKADAAEARVRAMPGATTKQIAGIAASAGPAPALAARLARGACASKPGSSVQADWQKLADAMIRAGHNGAGAVPQLDCRAHGAILETVEMLAETRDRIAAGDVLEALEGVTVAPVSGDSPGKVLVTDASRLRGRRYDAVVVGGLNAGDFSSEGRESLSADVVSRLTGRPHSSEQARERLLFYSVATRAREKVVFVRQSTDSDGNPARPSVLWEEALDLFRIPDSEQSEVPAAALSDSLGLGDIERWAPAVSGERRGLRIAAHDKVRPRCERGTLRDEKTLAWLASRRVFSVTELETYLRCPYQWFHDRLIRPGSLDSAFDAASQGELAHRVLRGFYTELPTRLGVPRVTRDCLPAAIELASEVFERELAHASTPRANTLEESQSVARARRAVIDLVADDAEFLPGFVPAHAELRFGEPGLADPPEEDGLDLGGGLRVRGCIDRIDEGGDGIVVIDYKMGEAPKLADFDPKRVLQLPIYAAVARRLTGLPVVAGLYRSLKRRESRGFHLAAAGVSDLLSRNDRLEAPGEIETLIEAALGRARQAADSIRAGLIAPLDPLPRACEFCSCRLYCPRESQA